MGFALNCLVSEADDSYLIHVLEVGVLLPLLRLGVFTPLVCSLRLPATKTDPVLRPFDRLKRAYPDLASIALFRSAALLRSGEPGATAVLRFDRVLTVRPGVYPDAPLAVADSCEVVDR